MEIGSSASEANQGRRNNQDDGIKAYRYIYSQLRMPTDFKKILMVFGDGRVGTLTG